ncbi:hypothetical protein [Desulfotruncus alcoholivorax]|uniref:hypothetical protein n=1 Tax=Desulfotruncus alcoholivorax TaxID=265477 RepID=UPI000429EFEF|nr:hypothetical protein [Desulfotruncus alcoholivorax]
MLKLIKRLLLKRRRQMEALFDVATIQVDDLTVTMSRRESNTNPPYEFSMYIPRLEFRQKYYKDRLEKDAKEIILENITIVHAPQHPPSESRNKVKYNICHKMD